MPACTPAPFRADVDADLVLDPEQGDPGQLLLELERPGRAVARVEADHEEERDDPRDEARGEGQRAGVARRRGRDEDRPHQRRERDDRQDRDVVDASSAGRQDEERAGHDDQADRDPQGVVLDPPGLDPAEARRLRRSSSRCRSRCRRRRAGRTTTGTPRSGRRSP